MIACTRRCIIPAAPGGSRSARRVTYAKLACPRRSPAPIIQSLGIHRRLKAPRLITPATIIAASSSPRCQPAAAAWNAAASVSRGIACKNYASHETTIITSNKRRLPLSFFFSLFTSSPRNEALRPEIMNKKRER